MVEYQCGDLRTKNGRCQMLVHIETNISKEKNEIKYVWRDYEKMIYESKFIKCDGDWKKLIEVITEQFPNIKFPDDEVEIIGR